MLYNDVEQTCQLSDQPAYIVYSASGSFFIPLIIMIFVYVNIYAATRARLRARAAADGRLAAAIVTTTAAPLPAEIALKTAAMIHKRSEVKAAFEPEAQINRQLTVTSQCNDVKEAETASSPASAMTSKRQRQHLYQLPGSRVSQRRRRQMTSPVRNTF